MIPQKDSPKEMGLLNRRCCHYSKREQPQFLVCRLCEPTKPTLPWLVAAKSLWSFLPAGQQLPLELNKEEPQPHTRCCCRPAPHWGPLPLCLSIGHWHFSPLAYSTGKCWKGSPVYPSPQRLFPCFFTQTLQKAPDPVEFWSSKGPHWFLMTEVRLCVCAEVNNFKLKQLKYYFWSFVHVIKYSMKDATKHNG